MRIIAISSCDEIFVSMENIEIYQVVMKLTRIHLLRFVQFAVYLFICGLNAMNLRRRMTEFSISLALR